MYLVDDYHDISSGDEIIALTTGKIHTNFAQLRQC